MRKPKADRGCSRRADRGELCGPDHHAAHVRVLLLQVLLKCNAARHRRTKVLRLRRDPPCHLVPSSVCGSCGGQAAGSRARGASARVEGGVRVCARISLRPAGTSDGKLSDILALTCLVVRPREIFLALAHLRVCRQPRPAVQQHGDLRPSWGLHMLLHRAPQGVRVVIMPGSISRKCLNMLQMYLPKLLRGYSMFTSMPSNL